MDFKKQFDFVKNRNKFFIISIALLVIGLIRYAYFWHEFRC